MADMRVMFEETSRLMICDLYGSEANSAAAKHFPPTYFSSCPFSTSLSSVALLRLCLSPVNSL